MRSVMNMGWLVCFWGLSAYWAAVWGGRTGWFMVYAFSFLLLYILAVYAVVKRGLSIEWLDGSRLEANECCIYAGEEIRQSYRLTFRGVLVPGIWLRLEERWVHQGTGERVVFREVAYLGLERSADVALCRGGLSRGRYVREALVVSAGDAFGLLRAERRVTAAGQLWVLPRPWAAAAAAEPTAGPPGPRPARRQPPAWASVPQISGTRPYAPGDPLRRIHWRSSARTGELRAIETELPAAGRQLIALDAAGAGGSAGAALWADPALAAAVEAAAGLAMRGLEHGGRVRLAVCDGQGSAVEAQGRERLPELLRLLAAAPSGGVRPEAFAEWALGEVRHAQGGAVTLVTARADAQLAEALRRLPRGSARIVYVHATPAALSEPVLAWKQRLEATGCRVTIMTPEDNGERSANRGGGGYAASGT